MSKLSKDLSAGVLHPRENIFATGTLGALNAEVQAVADGSATVGLVVTGTYVGTLTVEGSIDGANWDVIPVRPISAGGTYVLTLASAAVGRWQGSCAPFAVIRVRMSAWTSGAASVRLAADIGSAEVTAVPKAADASATVTAAIGVAATLTVAAPGAGLYHYFTRIIVQRFAGAVLTAAATPVLATTTNLPGTRVLSFPAEAAAQGTIYNEIIEPSQPLRSSAANTATTIVCPATTGVIWRVTADYYVAP